MKPNGVIIGIEGGEMVASLPLTEVGRNAISTQAVGGEHFGHANGIIAKLPGHQASIGGSRLDVGKGRPRNRHMPEMRRRKPMPPNRAGPDRRIATELDALLILEGIDHDAVRAHGDDAVRHHPVTVHDRAGDDPHSPMGVPEYGGMQVGAEPVRRHVSHDPGHIAGNVNALRNTCLLATFRPNYLQTILRRRRLYRPLDGRVRGIMSRAAR